MRFFESRKTLERLDQMVTESQNGSFSESNYDESELSRLESKWKKYLSNSNRTLQQTKVERERVKSLISDISHQTKTPLSNILLYTQLLEERLQGDENIILAREIGVYTQKLEFLIQSLVKMSRLESNVLEVIPKEQHITPLITGVVKNMQIKARNKNIEIKYPECGEIRAFYDLKWTLEALTNILDNAVKYSKEGSRITVNVKVYELYLCIQVTDEGMGISEEEKAQIFSRFYRGSQVQQEEGIGIGLYLAREIIGKEGGYIKVLSKLGKGSCFGIYLRKEEK